MKASITGINGFIGKTLHKKLLNEGWEVYSSLRPDVDYVFLFGSPSSNAQYSENLDVCVQDTINGFIHANQFCRDHNIRLIYPSSMVVKTNSTPYAYCKSALEDIQKIYDINSLGVRIACGYGPNESHKSYYSSIVYMFCKQMINDEQPVIWGDGTQTRDFIYQEDIVDAIFNLAQTERRGVVDVGTGINSSFNEVVDIINTQLGKNIRPIYINKPPKYVEFTQCDEPVNYRFSLVQGIWEILSRLK